MRSIRALLALTGAALALGPSAGCGGGEGGQAELAKLEPPSSVAVTKAPSKPMPPPKFGSPPKSKSAQP